MVKCVCVCVCVYGHVYIMYEMCIFTDILYTVYNTHMPPFTKLWVVQNSTYTGYLGT
jgi:hypothetical protein